MPVITLPLTAGHGPLIDVAVALPPREEEIRRRQGLPFVPPAVRSALLDTGSNRTLIDLAVADELGLEPTGYADVASEATGEGSEERRTFAVRLILLQPTSRVIAESRPEIGSHLRARGYGVILGRDVMTRFAVSYNGPSNSFTLSF
jgi:hypothetical protein